MASYKDELTAAMDALATDPLVRFIGYGIRYGKAGGTLKNVRDLQLIETTVTESLMVSMAIGLSLRGLKPVVFIERADFIWNAAGEFVPAVLIRVVVGNKEKPLFTGETHSRDNSEAMKRAVSFPVFTVTKPEEIKPTYAAAYRAMSVPDYKFRSSTMIYEMKDLI